MDPTISGQLWFKPKIWIQAILWHKTWPFLDLVFTSLVKKSSIYLIKRPFLHHHNGHSTSKHGGTRGQIMPFLPYILILKGGCFPEFSGNTIFWTIFRLGFQKKTYSNKIIACLSTQHMPLSFIIFGTVWLNTGHSKKLLHTFFWRRVL